MYDLHLQPAVLSQAPKIERAQQARFFKAASLFVSVRFEILERAWE